MHRSYEYAKITGVIVDTADNIVYLVKGENN